MHTHAWRTPGARTRRPISTRQREKPTKSLSHREWSSAIFHKMRITNRRRGSTVHDRRQRQREPLGASTENGELANKSLCKILVFYNRKRMRASDVYWRCTAHKCAVEALTGSSDGCVGLPALFASFRFGLEVCPRSFSAYVLQAITKRSINKHH